MLTVKYIVINLNIKINMIILSIHVCTSVYLPTQNWPIDGNKIETMITVDSMFLFMFIFLFGCLHTSKM